MRTCKSIFLLFIALISISCKENKAQIIEEGYITKTGVYFFKNKKLYFEAFENGTKIFYIKTNKNKLLYQSPIHIRFDDYHYWFIYLAKNQNIYFYNSDYSYQRVLIWDKEKKSYVEKDFCIDKVFIPEKLKAEMSKNSLKNCIN